MSLWTKLFGTTAPTPQTTAAPASGARHAPAPKPPRDRYVLVVFPWDERSLEQIQTAKGQMSASEHLRDTLEVHLPDALNRGKLPKDGEGGTVVRAVWGVVPRDPDHMVQLALEAFDVEFMNHAGAMTFEFKSLRDGRLISLSFGDGPAMLIARPRKAEPAPSRVQASEKQSVAAQSTSAARSGSEPAPADYKRDPFIARCLDVPYREMQDDRWFSHFKELPEIDALRKSGKAQEALALCRKGLEQYPDSFLFYKRGADLTDELGQPDETERLLVEGLSKSLSKCSITVALADRASANGNHRDAIRWWITGGVLQLDAKLMVDKMPFLNLAYVCQPIGIKDTERWLFEMADRASTQGPIRFNAEGAELRHRVARAAMAAGDDAAQHAIVAFHDKYK